MFLIKGSGTGGRVKTAPVNPGIGMSSPTAWLSLHCPAQQVLTGRGVCFAYRRDNACGRIGLCP